MLALSFASVFKGNVGLPVASVPLRPAPMGSLWELSVAGFSSGFPKEMLSSHLQVTTCLEPSSPYAGADFWLGFSGIVVAVASHPLPSATAGACWRWLLLLS